MPRPDLHLLTTERQAGDFALGRPAVERAELRRRTVDLPWVWLRQVHGAEVIVLDDERDLDAVRGVDGDALATTRSDVVLEVRTADCVPVLLWNDDAVGAAHAGWRGLEAGVVDATVRSLREIGTGTVHAVVGPHLRAGCNEFGAADLDRLVARFGPAVGSTTSWGTPAFDIDGALDAVLREADVVVDRRDPSCTGCDTRGRWYSNRMRSETGRMASVIWQTSDPR